MIKLKQIQRTFQVGKQQVQALQAINLQIESGEYLSIMGPSGSGKSTLLNILALLDLPSSGEYWLNNQNTTQLNDSQLAKMRLEHIGFVFQSFHLIPRLTAAENIEMPMILAGIDKKERQQRVQVALESVNLIERATHKPEQLSGGQMQRIAIARAMIMQPQILLADEPTGNLDSQSGQDIIQLLESVHQNKVTLIIITHDSNIGARAQRCIQLIDGQITHAL